MPGGPFVVYCLEERMLRWCVDNWKDSREMVSFLGLNVYQGNSHPKILQNDLKHVGGIVIATNK